jgi:glutaredoxin
MGCQGSRDHSEKHVEQVNCYLDHLKRDLGRYPVLVYSVSTCQASSRAKELLKHEAVVFEYFELDLLDCLDLVLALHTLTQSDKTPYVFVRGKYVGSTAELDHLLTSGEFKLLNEPLGQ